jgi:DNA-binding transcriptional LysR family regulator
VRLTEAGARYADDCRRILAGFAEADESVAALFGMRVVTPIVVEYLQRYPEVSASCWFIA